jgi:hypothetical protein
VFSFPELHASHTLFKVVALHCYGDADQMGRVKEDFVKFVRQGHTQLDPILKELGFDGSFHYIELVFNPEQELDLAIDLPILAHLTRTSIGFHYFDFDEYTIKNFFIQPF